MDNDDSERRPSTGRISHIQATGKEIAGDGPAHGRFATALETVAAAIDSQRRAGEQARTPVVRQRAAVKGLEGLAGDIFNSRIWRTMKGLARVAIRRFAPGPETDHAAAFHEQTAYQRWIADVEEADRALAVVKVAALTQRPSISIVLCAFEANGELMQRAIRSIEQQSYREWELWIAHTEIFPRLPKDDARIHWKMADGASALRAGSGEYVALLAPNCELASDALVRLIDAIHDNHDADLLYSDEDRIDSGGQRSNPFFKPAWSPDLLLSQDYISGLLAVRRTLMDRLYGLHVGSPYDLALRLAERAQKIIHIPQVLFHRRETESSASDEICKQALEQHLQRRRIAAAVEPASYPNTWRVRYAIPEGMRVSIIIPSAGRIAVLRANLEALVACTAYPYYDLLVIDNSRHDTVAQFVKQWTAHGRRAEYLDWRRKPFNYSAMNNQAARRSESPVLLFLNDDTQVIGAGWLTALLELAVRPAVGAVGAKLLYPGGRIQHAGIVMGIFEQCGHAFRGMQGAAPHYFNLPDTIRNVSAVTGACLMTRAEVFWQAGGFDEENFPIAYNDVDLCLKIAGRGYRVLYTPHALLYHHEAYSKGLKDVAPAAKEAAELRRRWPAVIEADPFYSPHLTRRREDYSIGLP